MWLNNIPALFLNSKVTKDVDSHTHLGLTSQCDVSLRNYPIKVYEEASKRFNMLKFVE